jgi:lipopolysaccharide transport system permease protein
MIGLAYLLSAIGVYFRDLKDFAQLFATAGVYLIPAFYMPDWVPSLVQPLLYLNPFSYPIWCFQDVLYFGGFQHPWAWVATTLLSVTLFAVGYRVFRQLKPGFGTVL